MPMPIPPKKHQQTLSTQYIHDLCKIKKHSIIVIKEYKEVKAFTLTLMIPAAVFWIFSYDMIGHVYFHYDNLLSSHNFIELIPCSIFFGSSAYIVSLPFLVSDLNTSIKKWRNLHTNSEKLIVDFKANKPNVEMDNAYKKLVEDFNALKKEEESS
jgi:hypothetical protein